MFKLVYFYCSILKLNKHIEGKFYWLEAVVGVELNKDLSLLGKLSIEKDL